uniref:triacylglycerol lipase n=1 Tax=Phallusia mammillata TaxID=59560 RepID=A0A6F9DH55_9ASCI|nr:uncharacterized protein LOC100179837 [Phallusia mammillata]
MVIAASKFDSINEEDQSKSSANTIHVGGKPKSISFSGCGFLGIYHIGVASCLKQHAPKLVRNFDRIYGCSAGSIIGTMLLTDVCFGEVCYRTMKIVADARSRYLGPLSPGFRLNESLIRDLRAGLPENAHELATGRLFISLTRLCDGKNVIVSDYKSREELIQVLICSCFVPFYSGVFPPKYRGVRYVDGGLSNNLPADDDTITVSPWSGNSDICPRNDNSTSLLDLSFVNTSIQLNASNLYRCSSMFFPKDPEELKEFCSQGFRETVHYLCDHGLFETVHPRRRNLTFSSELNKLSERKRITRRLSQTAKKLADVSELKVEEESRASHGSSRNSWSSDSTDEGAIEIMLGGDLKIEGMPDCFEETDNNNCAINIPVPEYSCNKTQIDGEKAFTVIHAYPIDEDNVLKLEFHLPPPVLEALESAFERNTIVSKLPFAKLLWSFRNSLILRVPIDKAYYLSYSILKRSSVVPTDLQWLTDHLRHLVEKLQSRFKCSGESLVLKLQSLGKQARKDIQWICDQINVTLQLLTKSMVQRGLYVTNWFKPFLQNVPLAKNLPFMVRRDSRVVLQVC